MLFNKPLGMISSYWFLFALIYAYFIYVVIKKCNLYSIAYIVIPCLFICYIVLAQGMMTVGRSMPNYVYKNFLIEGFPFFMMGHYLHYKQETINIKNSILTIIIGIFTVLCLMERYLLGRDFGINICTIPQVIALFLFGIKNPLRGEGVIQRIGKKYSMYVYLFHPVIWRLLGIFYRYVSINENLIALYLMPILTFLCSLLLAAGYVAALDCIKRIKSA